MPTETSAQQLPTLLYLFQSGGMPFVAATIGLAVIGIWMTIRPHNKTEVLVFAVFSLIPGIWAMVNVYLAASDFSAMASSTQPPKPAEFAAVTARAMANGFYGLLATLVPTALVIAAWMRGRSRDSSQLTRD